MTLDNSDYRESIKNLSNGDLKVLYYDMLRIRLVEEKIAERYPEQEMRCPVHLSVGQEAIAVGVCNNLEKSDYTLSTHRSHAHFLAKGGKLKNMISELYGKETGCSGGKGGSMHLVDPSIGFYAVPIIGSTIPMAVGIGLGLKMKESSSVSVVFFGDAATEEGAFTESLNYASLYKLPTIFICENNLYSIYTPLSARQPVDRSLLKIAESYGIEANICDGNDVVAINHLTNIAIEKARKGGGPTLLELTTYRIYEHCGPNNDNHLEYRSEEEFNNWKAKDPLKNLYSQLKNDLDFNSEMVLMTDTIGREIEDAFSYAKSSSYPSEGSLYEHLFSR